MELFRFHALPVLILYCILSWASVISKTDSRALTKYPVNTAVVTGTQATLVCASDSHLLVWSFQRDGETNASTIFSGVSINPDFIDIYSVDTSIPGSANLVILNATLSEVGVYLCRETSGTDPEQTVNLVVLDSEPVCFLNSSREDVSGGTAVVMKCIVTYTSNLSPMLMTWSDPSGNPVNSEALITPGRTESSITVTAQPPTIDGFICMSYFTEPSNATTTAKNAPTYTYNYTSPVVQVHHCPETIFIHIPTGSLMIGDELNCSSNGYPAPTYEWLVAETGEEQNESTIILTRMGKLTYTCVATVPSDDSTQCRLSTSVIVTVGARSCLHMQQGNPRVASGVYTIAVASGKSIEVYCEMGLGGGGYTFLSPASLLDLTDDDVQSLFTNRTQFLMRTRNSDGSQPYSVLKQLDRYKDYSLMIGLSREDGYYPTENTANEYLGSPYLYFGFLSSNDGVYLSSYGLNVNGVPLDYSKFVGEITNYIALIPGFLESSYIDMSTSSYTMCSYIFSTYARRVPSARVMPDSYFMFVESQWVAYGGADACLISSNSAPMNSLGIRSAAIGFK